MRTARSQSGDTHRPRNGVGILDETVSPPDIADTAFRFVGPPLRS